MTCDVCGTKLDANTAHRFVTHTDGVVACFCVEHCPRCFADTRAVETVRVP